MYESIFGACCILIPSFLGVLTNLLFVIMCFTSSELRKKYGIFLISIATLNVLCTGTMVLTDPYIIFADVESNSTLCQFSATSVAAFTHSAVSLQPLLNINRFIALKYPQKYEVVFSTKYTLCMVFASSIVASSGNLITWYIGDMGRLGHSLCIVRFHEIDVLSLLLIFIPVLLGYSISGVFGMGVMRILRAHQNERMTSEFKSQLKEAKQILILVGLEIIVPTCLESPLVLLSLLNKEIERNTLMYALYKSTFFYIMHMVIDPIMITLVMKPYRKQFLTLWNKFRHTVSPSTSSTNTSVVFSSQ